MTPSRWEHVCSLFDAALARSGADRDAFLASECGDDAHLRDDVESLLSAHYDADGFLSRGPVPVGAASGSSCSIAVEVLAPGTNVGVFEIETFAGAGGMGQIYRARDTRLDRRVALKLLPPEGAADSRARARFAYEARAIARLSHPHICALHDLGHHAGVDFLVMEYLDGETLAERLRTGPLPLHDALRIAMQIADALEAAHAEGIVHSDLKPANVMLVNGGGTGRGVAQAKLLDFGLARFQRVSPASASGLPGADLSGSSRTGVIAGTLRYMAPEQMRGEDADPRSDIFSLGCVMYEMVSGRAPFAGDSVHEVMSAILGPDAPELTFTESRSGTAGADVSRRFAAAVRRCLDKAPDRRFDRVSDLRAELAAIASDAAAGQTRPSNRGWITVVAGTAAIAMAVAGFSRLRDTPPAPSGAPMRVVTLTSLQGLEQTPTLSPDGTQVAFSWNGEREDNFDIYVQTIGSSDVRRLTTDPAADSLPTWSPDGQQIAFLRDHPSSGATVHAVHVSTGNQRLLTDFRIGSGGSARIAWSPDGRWIVGRPDVAQEAATLGYSSLYLIPVGGGRPRQLTESKLPDIDLAPAFSPDRRRLAYAHCSGVPRVCSVEVVDLNADYSASASPRHLAVGGLASTVAWTRDSRSVVYDSNARGPWELWRARVDGTSAPERLEIPGEHARRPVIAAAGDRLAFERPLEQINVFDVGRQGPPQPVLVSPTWDQNPRFSPDGQRLAFSSRRSGDVEEIWLAAADGSGARQLTRGPGRRQALPSWSPDGQQIAFESTAANSRRAIWVIPSAGGEPRQVTTGPGDERAPTWSRDGKRIHFQSGRAGEALPWGDTWQVPVEGGPPTRLTRGGSGQVRYESPDGRTLLYQPAVLYESTAPRPFAYMALGDTPLMAVPIGGGTPYELIPCVKALSFALVGTEVYFSPCGPGRYRNRDSGAVETWRSGDTIPIQVMDLATRRLRTAAAVQAPFDPGRIAVSPDRRRILVHRNIQASDLMLIENFR